jgi:GTP:adenosylcobinamide-phosphate guanylyltransferase
MGQMIKILSIIPARGGSKGLPRKNIIDLNGKPLIGWTIEASLKSKYITDTIVSSDDEEILNISQKYGVNTLKRPEELATDIEYDLKQRGAIGRSESLGSSLPDLESGELKLMEYTMTDGSPAKGAFTAVFVTTEETKLTLQGGFSANLEVVGL